MISHFVTALFTLFSTAYFLLAWAGGWHSGRDRRVHIPYSDEISCRRFGFSYFPVCISDRSHQTLRRAAP